ncbi:two-component sensor histidine kinase [Pseudomonas sp. Bc-h]|jgi:signal transduction histidine kinase|uniref:sensor histidine kinase n=1 Tax=Pseudomonas sp. Bc-h TaxID=1943632 RepID=UPI0009DAAE62|nr:HAMP domain-containing sensor histidine kinase [Pseudomonas sp. Bc-h]OQR28086.1 two-component sensor histidine kinase [Pseudomonas sp. Bc-h]
MDIKHSLKQRIVIVFALMSTLVAGVFAVGIIATVHVVEKRLTTISLGGNLHRQLTQDRIEDWRHRPEKDELFYADDGIGDVAMSDDLKNLEPGFQEFFRGKKEYYAMVETVGDRRYVLLRDQRKFEKRERILFGVVLVGFILSVLLAILLGRLLASRVMAPVSRLAGQVRHRDQLLEMAPTLADDYARDEVGALARSFDETLGRLRAALGREKLFTSDVSHELRTPLMVLATSCELLLEYPRLDERSRTQVQRISKATAGMNQLVETFLLLARTEGKNAPQGQRASVVQVAEELLEVWRVPIEEKGIQFVYVPCEGAEKLTYNAPLLRSVMGNLLRNAWHYTDHGAICLTLNPHGFSVEDSGIGIPQEKQQAMFQPFVRGDEQRGEGLGLGLSLVQRICANQGWSVTLTSREPAGCCFTVVLEAAEQSLG